MTPEDLYRAVAFSHLVLDVGLAQNNWQVLSPAPVALTPWLWIGSAEDAANATFLRDAGITHVLNCADATARGHVDPSLQYLQLDAEDAPFYPILPKHYALAKLFLDDVRRNAPRAKALVHCHAGLNRSVTLALAYLHAKERRSILGMARKLAKARPGTLSNPWFRDQLVAFHADPRAEVWYSGFFALPAWQSTAVPPPEALPLPRFDIDDDDDGSF